MRRFIFSMALQAEIEAFSLEDAKEAIRDCLGEEEDFCGVQIVSSEVLDFEELN